MNKSIIIIVISILLFLIISINGQSSISNNNNVAIGQAGNAQANINNTVSNGPIRITKFTQRNNLHHDRIKHYRMKRY